MYAATDHHYPNEDPKGYACAYPAAEVNVLHLLSNLPWPSSGELAICYTFALTTSGYYPHFNSCE